MHVSRLLYRLAANGIRYHYLRFTGKGSKPEALSLELTRRCIAQCIMCNVWKTPRGTPELPVSDWMRLLSSSVFIGLKELDITGGEPFLREDLSELLKEVCDLKGAHFRGLRSVVVTTNGFLTQRILDGVLEVVRLMKDRNIDLVLACAMDAVGDRHDRIRNFKGGWDGLHQTIQGLKEIRKSYDNVIIGLKTTIVPSNVDQLDRIAAYAEEHSLFTIISPCIIAANRYNNTDLEDVLRFSPKDRESMIRFYDSPRFQWSFHRDMMLNFFNEGVVKRPCSAGFNYFFVRSTGEVFPCPIIPMGIGNFNHVPVEELIHSEPANRFRRKVGRFPECLSCTEPGLERYALPFEGFHYLRLYFKLGKEGFLSLHEHMGLNKYLS